jgi:hypothetical protein
MQTEVSTIKMKKNQRISIDFLIPKVKSGDRIGFGGWVNSSGGIEIEIDSGPSNWVCVLPKNGAWGKFGSQWVSDKSGDVKFSISIMSTTNTDLALFELDAGHVVHEGIEQARPELLKNMWTFAPEGNFIPESDGVIELPGNLKSSDLTMDLFLKSCNRCGRFLPVNVQPNERVTLSFSNHCVSRAPCRHSSFGRIQDAEDPGIIIELDHGYQLECRFCKKFFVNAPLNPQRSAGQMKEDGARRRGFELLLEHLNQGSPQLAFKNQFGQDLASYVYKSFGGRCFKCGKEFQSQRAMHLDHTRPLALLWPLDQHATALCSVHNSEKRDRAPSDYYSKDELQKLAKITGLKISELANPSPNVKAIKLLIKRLDWFFEDFLMSGELGKVREGKATAELMLKALQKAIDKSPSGPLVDLMEEGRRRGFVS